MAAKHTLKLATPGFQPDGRPWRARRYVGSCTCGEWTTPPQRHLVTVERAYRGHVKQATQTVRRRRRRRNPPAPKPVTPQEQLPPELRSDATRPPAEAEGRAGSPGVAPGVARPEPSD